MSNTRVLKLCVLFAIVSYSCKSFVQCVTGIARPIQIAIPLNHTFQLQTSDLKAILENDLIKDRHAVLAHFAKERVSC